MGYLPRILTERACDIISGLMWRNPSVYTQIKYKNCPNPYNCWLHWPRWRRPIAFSSAMKWFSLEQQFPWDWHLKVFFLSCISVLGQSHKCFALYPKTETELKDKSSLRKPAGYGDGCIYIYIYLL